jgi:hypothetical protein
VAPAGRRSTRSSSASRRLGGAWHDARGEQLLGEQDCLAAAVHTLDDVGVGRRADDVRELVGDLVAVEARELDPPCARAALELGEQRSQRVALVGRPTGTWSRSSPASVRVADKSSGTSGRAVGQWMSSTYSSTGRSAPSDEIS